MFPHKSNLLLTLICPLAICLSCDSNTKWHTYQYVPVTGWERTDTMSFTLPEFADSTQQRLFLCMRTRCDAPWSRLHLGVEYRLASPDTIYRDTITIQLKEDSIPLLSGSTSLLQYQQPLTTLNSSRLRRATVRVFHLMQTEAVPFVTDIGLRIEIE